MAVLEMLNGNKAGQRYALNKDTAVLGRHPECTIVLDQGAVSRQHAQISYLEGDYFVEDLQSRNGTYVNAAPVQTRYKLQNGDKLKICDLEFTFFRDAKSIRQTVSQRITDTTFGPGMYWDDDQPHGNSQIMSKLEVSSLATGVRLAVNPEMKLRALIEITQNLGKALSVDAVLPKLLDSLFKIFVQADRGFVILRGADGRLIPKAVKHRREEQDDEIRISRTIVNQVLDTKEAILSADASSDARFDMSQSIADFRIRSMMCAPLVNADGVSLGVIQLDTVDHRSRFEQEDLDVLAGVASQAAISLDNATMHEAAIRQNQIERDLKLAHKVQQGLLPSQPPKIEGYHFFDFYEAANQVGGDFYDYIQLPNGRLAVVLADVSGKGVSAALVMAKLSADVRYCLVSEPTVASAVQQINRNFSRSGWEDRFVTFVLTVLDPREHEVTIANAGHMPPFLRLGEGRVDSLAAEIAGIPLGVDDDYQYETTSVRLEQGQFVSLFTDGFSEAMNANNELYGLDRFKNLMGGTLQNVGELGRIILSDVKSFVGGHPQSDDMCLVCFGRDGV